MDDVPIFRAVKRRKHVHKQDTSAPTTISDEETPSQIIKLRTQPRARPKGVQFINQKSSTNESESLDWISTNIPQQSTEQTSQYSINSRFVGSSTGQVVNVDKHMTAYVDHQMAKQNSSISNISALKSRYANPQSMSMNGNESLRHHADDNQNDEEKDNEDDVSSRSPSPTPPPSSAAVPKPGSFQPLSEIDLSTLPSHSSSFAGSTNPPIPRRKGPRRPRLGRDGKPFRPRQHQRRDSNDIARDGLVEQVLHENAPSAGPYSSSAGGPTNPTTETSRLDSKTARQGNNEELDEKMAMEFQRQFLDAVSERQQQQRTAKSTAASGGGTGGTGATASLSGPRLGGSRSARAKLVAAMQAQAQAQMATGVEGKGKDGVKG